MLFSMACAYGVDSTSTKQTGSYSPTANPGTGSDSTGGGDNSLHCGDWHWVTVWENGQPTSELQPIECVEGINPDRGDPAPKVVDPNPWDINQESLLKTETKR